MFIWGSGTKINQWALADGRVLVLQWRYSHLFWCPITHHLRYFIHADKRSEDIELSLDQASQLLPAGVTPISFWQRYGGYVFLRNRNLDHLRLSHSIRPSRCMSVAPQPAQKLLKRSGVTFDRVHDVLLAKVVLQGACVAPVVRQLVAGRVPQRGRVRDTKSGSTEVTTVHFQIQATWASDNVGGELAPQRGVVHGTNGSDRHDISKLRGHSDQRPLDATAARLHRHDDDFQPTVRVDLVCPLLPKRRRDRFFPKFSGPSRF
jgi:hypothetical protein